MNVNVGTIGHIDHGKTTLTHALVRVLGDELANQCVIVTDGENIGTKTLYSAFDEDIYTGWPSECGRRKSKTRKAAKRKRMKAAQLKAFTGDH